MDLDQNRNFSCSSQRWRVNIGRSASKTNFSSLGDIEYRMLILDRRRMKKKGDENDFQNFYEILFNGEFEHAPIDIHPFPKKKKKKEFSKRCKFIGRKYLYLHRNVFIERNTLFYEKFLRRDE